MFSLRLITYVPSTIWFELPSTYHRSVNFVLAQFITKSCIEWYNHSVNIFFSILQLCRVLVLVVIVPVFWV